jgi:hypothetical protein
MNGLLNGIRVRVAPLLLNRSTDIRWVGGRRLPQEEIIVWSMVTARLMLAGVRWHDDADHCPTWAVGCSCDRGDEE